MIKMLQFLTLIFLLFGNLLKDFQVEAFPTPDDKASASASANIRSPLTLGHDHVGVNFMGYEASAGLGGLLTGDSAHGGLYAEAATPFGQKAGAGLGGKVAGQRRSTGALYSGATAGGGVAAGAELGASSSGLYEAAYSDSSAGGAYESVGVVHSPGAAGSFSASIGGAVSKKVDAFPVKETQIVVEKEVKPAKTYIERTVIPNYVEKTIHVPSYVEKTIRVPTVIEKRVKVPAAPTVIEKEVQVPASAVVASGVEKEIVSDTPFAVYHKTKFHSRPHHLHHFRKFFTFGGGAEGGHGGGAAGGSYAGSASFSKSINGQQLVENIFNIPISTLGAVSKLVGGIAGGTSGSLAVSKSFSASTV